jgi:hypothetical protein
MQRNISRAYDALWAERQHIRAEHAKILAKNDATLARKLLRAKRDDDAHQKEVVVYEERLSGPQRRRIHGLNSYGRKIERLMDALLKL